MQPKARKCTRWTQTSTCNTVSFCFQLLKADVIKVNDEYSKVHQVYFKVLFIYTIQRFFIYTFWETNPKIQHMKLFKCLLCLWKAKTIRQFGVVFYNLLKPTFYLSFKLFCILQFLNQYLFYVSVETDLEAVKSLHMYV